MKMGISSLLVKSKTHFAFNVVQLQHGVTIGNVEENGYHGNVHYLS
jgi:hypothetical protein